MTDSLKARNKLNEGEREDLRLRRTRKRLTEAVLSLASERDISATYVSELTRRARISRSTFYEHARNPVELLTRALSEDLERVRAESFDHLRSVLNRTRDPQKNGIRILIDHVVKYEAIYGAGHTSSIVALRVVLAESAERALLEILSKGLIKPPIQDERALPILAAFYGYGAAAAIEAWLRLPPPRDIDLVVDTLRVSYPEWLIEPSRDPNRDPSQAKEPGSEVKR